MTIQRFALVGTGQRGLGMFAKPLEREFPGSAALVAVCDPNPKRMAALVAELASAPAQYTDFDRMLAETNPDGVIVASRDATHAQYVVAALKAHKRVYCEKPLCVTAGQCRDILAAARRSRGLCLVTHNVRYGAATQAIRDVIRSGRLGPIRFMQFDETLDRCHGADYFRRWHARKANSGGLLIHKASHHFDQINWWAAARPAWVSASGSLQFYGRNHSFRGRRCLDCEHAARCEFHVEMFQHDFNEKFYRQAEEADGYFRDGCVWAEDIDIEDQMAVLIRYDSGLEVSYSLTAYSPYESQRTVIEGAKGRLEYFAVLDTGWAVGSQRLPGVETIAREELRLFTPAEGMVDLSIRRKEGGHGGADPALRADFFGRDWWENRNERMASLEEAVQAVLIGAAANESMRTALPVAVQDMLKSGLASLA